MIGFNVIFSINKYKSNKNCFVWVLVVFILNIKWNRWGIIVYNVIWEGDSSEFNVVGVLNVSKVVMR